MSIETPHRNDPAQLTLLQQTRDGRSGVGQIKKAVFAYYFAWYNRDHRDIDGYSPYSVTPTFKQRHGLDYLNRSYDPDDDQDYVDRVYAADCADLRDYNADCVILFLSETDPQSAIFGWNRREEEYRIYPIRRFAQNRMCYILTLPRWADGRWWSDVKLSNPAVYGREVVATARRIDESINRILEISEDNGEGFHHTDSSGKPVVWVFAANGVPVGSPDLFWRDVNANRKTRDAVSLWGLPHLLDPQGGARIDTDEHGFSTIAWYSQVSHVPRSRWRNLREDRPIIIESDSDCRALFAEIAKTAESLLHAYGPARVVLPVATSFDNHAVTWRWTGANPICPPIIDNPALFEQMWLRFFEEHEVSALSVSHNEWMEREAVAPQVEWNHAPWIDRLRKRLIVGGTGG